MTSRRIQMVANVEAMVRKLQEQKLQHSLEHKSGVRC